MGFSLGVEWPGREGDHSPPSSAGIKECVELYFHSSIRLHGVVLRKRAQGNFTLLYFTLLYFTSSHVTHYIFNITVFFSV
jgi:hypothetical protein